MANSEFLAEQGLRIDGRRFDELRNIDCRLGVFSQADGSAYLEWGNTKVLAVVYGPHETRLASQRRSDGAVINCQYSQAVFSTSERKNRPRGDRRALEFTQQLKDALQSVIIDSLYPRSQIDIYVEVLQADGGRESACVNAAVLALMDAGVALRDLMTSCTAAVVGSVAGQDTALVDLSNAELGGEGGRVTSALLPRSGELPLLSVSRRLHVERLSLALRAAEEASRRVHAVLTSAVKRHVASARAVAEGVTVAGGDRDQVMATE